MAESGEQTEEETQNISEDYNVHEVRAEIMCLLFSLHSFQNFTICTEKNRLLQQKVCAGGDIVRKEDLHTLTLCLFLTA